MTQDTAHMLEYVSAWLCPQTALTGKYPQEQLPKLVHSGLIFWDRAPWCLSIKKSPSVYLWILRCENISLLITRYFDVTKFTILSPLSLYFCVYSFSQVSVLKYLPSPHVHWSLLSNFCVVLTKWSTGRCFLIISVLRVTTFMLSRWVRVQNTNITLTGGQ
jgi:hypothetical protein